MSKSSVDISEIYVTVRLVGNKLELATTSLETIKEILYPSGGQRLGVVLMDSEKHLGVEKQAVPILKQLFVEAGCDGDGFGDVSWDDKFAFGWLGPNKVQWNPATFKQADRAVGAKFRDGKYQVLTPSKLRAVDALTKIRKRKRVVRRVTTEMIHWRGGQMEFVCRASQYGEKATQPPWYVVEISGGVWEGTEWYSWIDYRGPPKVFLTRPMAARHAKNMRNQYKCRARVVSIGPIDE